MQFLTYSMCSNGKVFAMEQTLYSVKHNSEIFRLLKQASLLAGTVSKTYL